MNRIYKVIYSKAHQCYVVVSELAKRNHKSSQSSIDHSTPALARIIAVTIAAGALTLGSTPDISWAADNTAGSGNGVAIGTSSNAPKNENVAIGKGAGISYSNGASTATGDIVVGSGANINNYASQGGSIAIGKNAKVENMAGGGEASFAFGQTTFSGGGWSSSRIPADPSKVVGSIAIGDNTFARTGSTMIGSHNYKGKLGDTTVDSASTRKDALNVYATTIGANSFSNGAFTTNTGAYNIISSDYNGGRLANPVKNMGATITGALNSIESIKYAGYYSGIANTINGIANRTSNSNGTLIYGAGNEVTNSITLLTSIPDDSGSSAKAFADTLRKTIKDEKGGGATLVIGGGNVADYTQKTQILGVNNTVTGTKNNISDYNMIDGFGNTITGASHLYTIGTNNKISNTKNTILAGDDYTNVSGLTDSVIIGNNRVKGDEKAEFAYFNNQKNIVSIGNKNVLDSTDGSISIGNNNFMWRSGGQPEKYGYDTGNVAIGNNTYINSYLNQGDSIVIGKNATVINMGGSLEKAFAFGTPEGKDYSGSIAIGQNSYARSGSTMIGIHNYQGKLGDLDIDFTKDKSEGHSGIGKYQESIDATTIGNNSYNNGVFSTVVGSYTAVSGLYHNQKWGEKPYGVQNFGAAVFGSLNSVEGLTSTEHNTAGMADSILGSANRTKNANGTVMVGAGNVVEDSINDFDASEIKTKDGIANPNALSEAMRTFIKNANGGGAAAIVGNGNEVKKSTNIAVVGSKNSVTSTTNSQIFGDNRTVTGADGAPIDGAVIIGSAAQTNPLTTNKKNVTILGYNANATVDGGAAIGAGSVASREAGVAGYDPATKKASEETSATWKATDAAVSVGKADGTMTRQITGVAAGRAATDAVNVAQLQKALAGAKDGNDTLQADKNALKLNGNTLSMSVKDTAGNEVSGSVDLSRFAQAVDTNTTYTLSGQANQDNTTTITLKDSNGRENSVTVATKDTDTRNTVKAGENVTLDTKDNADGSHEYTVNVKADGKVEAGSTKIVSGGTVYNETRVKQDGKYVKAANTAGENLSALDSQVASNASNITNINGRVNNLDSKINKVGAGAAALAALHPLDFDPDDKWDFAVGYGNYRDANSAAVGAFYRPDEDTMFSLGTNFGNGENMINAGVSFKFGPKGKSQVRPGSTQEITELRATVARQDDQLKKQDNEIKELKAMVQQLMAKQDKQAATK